ncbi:MAG: tetratricopeptide repeat protein [Candidatus Hodarchaeales archaeon]
MEKIFENIEFLIDQGRYFEAQNEIDKNRKRDLPKEDILSMENLQFYLLIVKEKKTNKIGGVLDLLEKNKLYGNKKQQIDAFTNVFSSFFKSHDFVNNKEHFDSYFQECKAFLEKIGDKNDFLIKKRLARLFVSIGWNLFQIERDYDSARDYFKKAQNLSKNFSFSNAFSFNGIGHSYLVLGELNPALENFEKGIEILTKLQTPNVVELLNCAGIIHAYKGNHDLALERYNKALDFANDFEIKDDWLETTKLLIESNIGESLIAKGDIESGLEVFQKQLPLLKKRGNLGSIINCFYDLIKFGSNSIPQPQLDAYLKEMELSVSSNNTDQQISQRYRLAKGILLKNSERLQDIATAQQLFREVANEYTIWFELTIESMMHLGESLLNEFKLTQSETVLNEFSELVQQIFKIAKKQNSYWLLTEVYLLKAKLELINFNFKEFEQFLMKAQLNAEEKGLDVLILRIEKEKKSFEEQLEIWNRLRGRNASYYDRVKQAQLIEYMKDAKNLSLSS